MANLVL